jgi:peptidoglycan hydrolase-like protein with peptidoglycan-binding domain
VTSATTATLSGTVDPNGSDTSYAFEYGTTASFGKTTASQSAGAAAGEVAASANVSGLRPDTTYDFALVATSVAGTIVGVTQTFTTGQSSCVAQAAVVSQDSEALQSATDTLKVDELQSGSGVASAQENLASDEQALGAAEQALSSDESQQANPDTTFTSLPAAGTVLHRGSPVYSLDGHPVPLFYGSVIFDRALYLGVSDGPDVTELQANLIALGFGDGITASPHFSAATEQAVERWQSSLGVPATGVVALGDFVLETGPIQVDTVSASLGQSAQPGAAVLTATSTERVVTIALDSAEQSEVKVGDPVTITLPDNATTPGVVSSVGTVATSSSSSSGTTGGSSGSTVSVVVTPTDPAATGDYDQAPVEVAITNASVPRAFVVPVDALLALASGGYALEEIGARGIHHLVAVNLGLFDDADGLVQVSGSGIAAGQKVVVPGL